MNDATRRPRVAAGISHPSRPAGNGQRRSQWRDASSRSNGGGSGAGAVVPRGVVEQALRDVGRTTIGVIGSGATDVAGWLREAGREVELLTLTGSGATRHKSARRVAARREVIVATDCIEHAADPAACLSEIKRLLSPSGRLILVAQNGTHASVRLAMLLGQYSLSGGGSAVRLFTPSDVEQLLNEAGFTVIGVERHIDHADVVASANGRVAESILELLSRDVDAMTSHFAFVAEPHAVAPIGVLRRRVCEMAEQQREAARDAQVLQHRVTALEARADRDSSDGRMLAEAGTVQAAAAIERLEEQVRRIGERVDALAREQERSRARSRDALLARVGEMKGVMARLERGRYQRLILRIREIVSHHVRRGSIVAVVSRGDPDLVTFDRRHGWHFPQTEHGVYAGCHPADSAEAIAHLEHLRARGARYLVIPETAFWWLDHYREFAEHLERRHRCLLRDERTCVLFALRGRGSR